MYFACDNEATSRFITFVTAPLFFITTALAGSPVLQEMFEDITSYWSGVLIMFGFEMIGLMALFTFGLLVVFCIAFLMLGDE